MQKINRIEDFSGKTIRIATKSAYGRVVIVFDDNDWTVLEVDDCACGDAHVDIHPYSHNENVRNYLSPEQLLRAELVTQAQYEFIKKEDAAKEAERKRSYAEKLLAEAVQLEQHA